MTSESIEQINFVLWFRHRHPKTLIFSVPNGGTRNKVEAMKLKREGIVPGIPDIFIPEWRLWIEMKRVKGGTVSKVQKEVMAELRRVGYQCEVAKGFEAAKVIVDKWVQTSTMNKTKEKQI